jgi:hypothetical protein
MTDITRALKQSIAFEKSKRDIANLRTHKPDDLSVMIDTITHAINECESDISLTESCALILRTSVNASMIYVLGE